MTTAGPTRTQEFLGQINSVFLPAAMKLINFRISHYDRSVDPARPEYNEHVIFAFWHEYISVVLPHWGHTPLTILTSQHKDGEYVTQTARYLRMHIVRGSTSRGGSAAIRQLKKNAKFSSLTLTPDGPRGPRREMAMGPIFLASLLKMPIVPVGVGMQNPWRLKTWDRFAIPRPLSRVRMIFGPKIYVDRKTTRESLDDVRLGVQRLMNELCDSAQSWADSGKKMIREQPFVRARRCNKLYFDQPAKTVLSVTPQSCLRRAA